MLKKAKDDMEKLFELISTKVKARHSPRVIKHVGEDRPPVLIVPGERLLEDLSAIVGGYQRLEFRKQVKDGEVHAFLIYKEQESLSRREIEHTIVHLVAKKKIKEKRDSYGESMRQKILDRKSENVTRRTKDDVC